MATRTINTRILLEGEKEYRNAIHQISLEAKTLQAQMRAVSATYAEAQNTTEALAAKQKALQDVIKNLEARLQTEMTALQKSAEQSKAFADRAEEARNAIAQKEAELAKLRSSDEDTAQAEAKLTAEIKALKEELALAEANEQRAAASEQKHATAIYDTESKLANYNRELQRTSGYLKEAEGSTDGTAKSIDFLGRELKQTGGEAGGVADIFGALKEKFGGLATGAGVAVALKAIASALKDCFNAAMQFESAMAGVAKTTNLSGDELEKMGRDIRDLTKTMPITAAGFAGIVETAGQLGIEQENLLAFSKVMANLGVATNMTSEEAATMLAQFVAITGMDRTAQAFDSLGAAVVALGNNFATTESKIVEMSQGFAGAAANAGLSEANMLAWSTAVSSVGMESAAGATNLSKLVTSMQTAVETGDKLTEWADACHMETYELSALWKTDANAALKAFISNVDDGDASLAAMLKTLGLNDVRMQRMVTSLANYESTQGGLTRALELANVAWDESNALTQEAETRYETTQSQLTVLSNAFTDLKIAIGDTFKEDVAESAGWMAKVLENLTEQVYKLHDYNVALDEVAVCMEMAGAAAGNMSGSVDDVTSSLEYLQSLEDGPRSQIEGIGDAAEKMAEQIGYSAQTAMDYIDEMVSAYNAAYDAALNAANEAFDLFDGVTARYAKNQKQASKEVDDYIAKLGEQQEFWERYAANIQAAMEMGVDEGLIAKLSDGSEESAQILDTIVQSGGEKVAELNEALANVDSGKETFATSVAEMQTNFTDAAETMVGEAEQMVEDMNQKTEANSAAKDTIQGYIDGLNEKLKDLRAKIAEVNGAAGELDLSGGEGHKAASGLSYVPYDEFPAVLHKGEMVLTAFEAAAYRAARRQTGPAQIVAPEHNGTQNVVFNNAADPARGRSVVENTSSNSINLYIDGIKYNTDEYVDDSITKFVENMVRRGRMYGRT